MKPVWRPIAPIQYDSRGVLQQAWELGFIGHDYQWHQIRVEWCDVPKNVPISHWNKEAKEEELWHTSS